MDGYELTVTAERIHNLTQGRSSDGYRVRYRREGTRPWRSFLLTMDGRRGRPSDALIERAVRAHEEANGT